MSDLERFMSHARRDDATGCLLWTGGLVNGYGQFWANGGSIKAHRWIFREKFGYLPEVVMHRCDTPACVDWERCLTAGTFGTNNADRNSKGRQATRESHGRTSLTTAIVAEIRSTYAAGGVTQRDLAKQYGIGKSQVSNIIRGVHW